MEDVSGAAVVEVDVPEMPSHWRQEHSRRSDSAAAENQMVAQSWSVSHKRIALGGGLSISALFVVLLSVWVLEWNPPGHFGIFVCLV